MAVPGQALARRVAAYVCAMAMMGFAHGAALLGPRVTNHASGGVR
jgi:hypothetical protein